MKFYERNITNLNNTYFLSCLLSINRYDTYRYELHVLGCPEWKSIFVCVFVSISSIFIRSMHIIRKKTYLSVWIYTSTSTTHFFPRTLSFVNLVPHLCLCALTRVFVYHKYNIQYINMCVVHCGGELCSHIVFVFHFIPYSSI